MEKRMPVDLLIESNSKSFTKSEKVVADYTLENINDIYYQTLNDISSKCGVGDATVMRFIKKLGFSSFAEYKVSVATALFKQDEQEDEDPLKMFQNDINNLTNETLIMNDRKTLNKVVDLIEKSKHVVFMGNGTSGHVAELIAYRFVRAGLECEAVTDVHFSEIRSALLGKGDVLIAISHSGDNVDLNNPVKRAKKQGCKIVSVTAYQNTELVKLADISLFNVPGPVEHRIYGAGMRNIINQEFLVELLYIIYKERHFDEVMQVQKKTAFSTAVHHTIINGK